ncbi:hypothetical protein [Marinococcus halophilus]|uniref:hypothetical protein n=1 Tax=Marinococcus halophilus TaxID=1371 RepID=UPI0009A9067C|nr:hypothetical protein [Marinococcus halophilus]
MNHQACIRTTLGAAAFVAVFCYFLEVLLHVPYIEYAYSFIAGVLLVASLPVMPALNRRIVYVLLAVGIALFWIYGVSWHIVWTSFGENLSLLALFLTVPLIGTYMSEAGHLHAFQQYLERRNEKKAVPPHQLGYGVTASIGAILNLGSMPLVYGIAKESFPSFEQKRMALTVLRGFGSCMLWSPYFVNMALILSIYDLSWSEVGPYGIIMAAVLTILVIVFFRASAFADDTWTSPGKNKEAKPPMTSMRTFLLFLGILLGASFLLEMLLPYNMLTIVSILALLYPWTWALALKQATSFAQSTWKHVSGSFERLYNEIGIFVTAGFFSVALRSSDAGAWLSEAVSFLSQGYMILLIAWVVAIVMGLSTLGIHPVIIVTGLGGALSPEVFGVEASFMAVLLLMSWMLGVQVSPFTGAILMSSHLMGTTTIQVIRKNAAFILSAAVVLSLVLFILGETIM